MSARPKSAGFTLLEVLIATALLGVAMVSLMGLHGRNLRLTSEAQDMTVAGLLASQLIAGAQVADFPDVDSEEGRFTDDKDFFGASDLRYGGPGSDRFVWKREVLPTALDSLRQVRISISREDEIAPLATMMVVVRKEGGQ